MKRQQFFREKHIYLLMEFIMAKLKIKNQRSTIGILWSFLNPLMMTIVLYFLFRSRIGQGRHNDYFLYVLIGTVTWNFFVMTTSFGLISLKRRADMCKNIIFPKETLVYSDVGLFTIQHFFELIVVFLVVSISGIGFGLSLIFLPFIIALQILQMTGIALFLSCLHATFVNDLDQIWNVATRILFFTVPVFYSFHDIHIIERLCNKLLVLNKGQQIAFGPTSEIIRGAKVPAILNKK